MLAAVVPVEVHGVNKPVSKSPLTIPDGGGGGVVVQPGSANDASRVRQVPPSVDAMYSCAYQKVQSSTGSTLIAE